MNNSLNLCLNSMFILLIIVISLTSVATNKDIPDMCLHSARFDSLTQFTYTDNSRVKVFYFFASQGYYWIIGSKEYPTTNNTKGRLPHGFRGDAAFFRQWKRCDDKSLFVPMVVVVDANQLDLKYMIYFIHNQTWTQPYNASEDKALSKVTLYDGFKTVDTIINFANIKMGPFADKLGDESIFIISSAQNNSIYYEWVGLTGCLENEGEFKGKAHNYFNGLLERGFWKMNTSIDAAMVFTIYPNSDPKKSPTAADISLFQANTHYMFTVSLKLIENGLLYCDRKEVLPQYYSTWMGCAEGLTPEPPIFISNLTTMRPSVTGNVNLDDPDQTLDDFEALNSTPKWRPILEHPNPIHDPSHEDDGTFKAVVISVLMVVTVVTVLMVILVYMFVYSKGEEKETS